MNGEIYNHLTLAREATANDFPPLNPSDTATFAALLCFLSLEQVLNRIRGMFALALFHTPTQTLYLIRDRMGVKPLYWNLRDGQLSWGSELSAVPTEGLEINAEAVTQFLMFEYIPAPNTIIEQTHKLLPGELLSFSKGTLKKRIWWEPPSISEDRDKDMVPWRKAFSFALHGSVRLRVPSDLPTAVQLSGGLDSSLLATLLPKPKESIAYTLQILEDGIDESDKAKTVAQALGIPLRIISFSRADFLPTAQEVLAHLSEPIADSSILPYWKFMKEVRKDGIRCMLSGDGSDESLGGYPTYSVLTYAQLLQPFQNRLQSLAHRVPRTKSPLSRRNMAKHFIEGLHPQWWKQQQQWMGAWLPEELCLGSKESIWDSTKMWANKAGSNPIARALYLDQRMYLAEGVLQKVDRISMAFGVEIRAPFMDDRMVSLMATLPQNAKVPGKRIIRDILSEKKLPRSITHQKKQGFGAPLGMWISDISFSAAQLTSLEPYVSSERILTCITEHQEGKADHRRRIWSAYCLAVWLENRKKTTSIK
jgi:asparagine synthase (glutamine-hydrolysing)